MKLGRTDESKCVSDKEMNWMTESQYAGKDLDMKSLYILHCEFTRAIPV